jgi:hypothetical protein
MRKRNEGAIFFSDSRSRGLAIPEIEHLKEVCEKLLDYEATYLTYDPRTKP